MRNILFIMATVVVGLLLVMGISCHDAGKDNGIGVAATDPTHLSASKTLETKMFDFSDATRLTQGDARPFIAFSRQN